MRARNTNRNLRPELGRHTVILGTPLVIHQGKRDNLVPLGFGRVFWTAAGAIATPGVAVRFSVRLRSVFIRLGVIVSFHLATLTFFA